MKIVCWTSQASKSCGAVATDMTDFEILLYLRNTYYTDCIITHSFEISQSDWRKWESREEKTVRRQRHQG